MTLPTWSHCIATLNRIDILEEAVRLSVTQTCPPLEIIIVDASDDITAHRARIEQIIATCADPQPALTYLHSPVKSLTHQRNLAIRRAKGDIFFLFDDDTLMYRDCAEAIVKAFAADTGRAIAAAMARDRAAMPGEAAVEEDARKLTGSAELFRNRLLDTPIAEWAWNKIFMMNSASHFVAYDTPRRMVRPDMIRIGAQHLLRVPLLSGFAMAIRAEVARKEPFDDTLLSYCPGEDLDASYRFSRHGLNVVVDAGRVHHFEAASGRIKRRQATTLGLMNIAAFVAKRSTRPARDIPSYYLRYLRRLLAEFLKDGLSRRFTFPQFIGVLAAFGPSVAIFRHRRDGFDDWYRLQQMRVLGWSKPPVAPDPGLLSSTPRNQGLGK